MSASNSSTQGCRGETEAGFIIVAGPKGAGKSTFANCLLADCLPHDILAELPSSARISSTSSVKHINAARGEDRSRNSTAENYILQIATNRIEDPLFRRKLIRIISRARQDIYVVTVVVDANGLARQFLARFLDPRTHFRARRTLRGYARGVLSYVKKTLKPKNMLQVLSYRWTDSVDRNYRRWESFLGELPNEITPRRKYSFLYVKPCIDKSGQKSFRLVSQASVAVPAVRADERRWVAPAVSLIVLRALTWLQIPPQ